MIDTAMPHHYPSANCEPTRGAPEDHMNSYLKSFSLLHSPQQASAAGSAPTVIVVTHGQQPVVHQPVINQLQSSHCMNLQRLNSTDVPLAVPVVESTEEERSPDYRTDHQLRSSPLAYTFGKDSGAPVKIDQILPRPSSAMAVDTYDRSDSGHSDSDGASPNAIQDIREMVREIHESIFGPADRKRRGSQNVKQPGNNNAPPLATTSVPTHKRNRSAKKAFSTASESTSVSESPRRSKYQQSVEALPPPTLRGAPGRVIPAPVPSYLRASKASSSDDANTSYYRPAVASVPRRAVGSAEFAVMGNSNGRNPCGQGSIAGKTHSRAGSIAAQTHSRAGSIAGKTHSRAASIAGKTHSRAASRIGGTSVAERKKRSSCCSTPVTYREKESTGGCNKAKATPSVKSVSEVEDSFMSYSYGSVIGDQSVATRGSRW